jgi:hypothetical protein
MSTGADCRFIEVEPGKWIYELQQWPYGEWPEYEKAGPFDSYHKAVDHLDANHANPGGWSTQMHPTGHVHEFEEDRWEHEVRCFACSAKPGQEAPVVMDKV